tara:strand:+ start:225 stop:407 length:183 start_codon:yes stop_codon:yes gene_type:complete
MNEGPFTSKFGEDLEGVIRREIITYRWKNNMLTKEIAIRKYYKNGDYNDSVATSPLPSPE